MNLENVQLNFKIICFILYNLEKIIDNLEFKFYTFTSSNFYLMNFVFINSNTSHTIKNAV